MSPEQENFESLRRLLTLKRYEQPPPGYFSQFSRQVTLQLNTSRAGAPGALERWLGEAPWMQRIWASLEGNPYVAGAFGVGVCGLLLGAVLWADRLDNQPLAYPMTTSLSIGAAEPQPASVDSVFARAALGPSTSGFLPQQPRSSLFQDFQRSHQAPHGSLVNFATPGGN